MRILLANSLAVIFLCACASVFYVWTGLERALGRYKRGLGEPRSSGFRDQLGDLSRKTFRALLAMPGAQRPHLGDSDNTNNFTGRGYFAGTLTYGKQPGLNVSNSGAMKEVPIRLSDLVEDGVFWNDRMDALLSAGFSEAHAQTWRQRARASRVVSLEPGCGRTSNRLARFSDGTKACVRYGINADQVLGETLSYYLASLLGIANLPPLALSQVSPSSEQWATVKEDMADLQWSDKAVVSLTEWVANLTGVVTPAPLRQEGRGLNPLRADLDNRTLGELQELVQWTDLIVFDYLTANFDRLVSNLFSLQWDSRVMERDTNNLLKSPAGDLVFIDNEAGLVHGYRVLHMWEQYHKTLLSSVCLFRKRTASRIIEMHQKRDAPSRLLGLYQDSESLAPVLGFLSDEQAGVLQERIDYLYKHILNCKRTYSQL
ncbi:four-jointed box protein 1 [Lepisosteus oculatus]|uniref:four-jointed box protein 1 n=1 Tax=Lepisosteus oculatus TaxID=7918 RepID=UPI0035F528AB